MSYRGYDSAGICLCQQDEVQTIRTKGSVEVLEKKLNLYEVINATTGIGHTRWATHGAPSERNAHPHGSENEEIMVVHNGTLDNFESLRKMLDQAGYSLKSDTDTEVIAQLVLYVSRTSRFPIEQASTYLAHQDSGATSHFWLCAVAAALNLIEGTFGLCFLFRDSPNLMICARRGSPVLVSCGRVGNPFFVVASDPAAILSADIKTKECVDTSDQPGKMIRVMEDEDIFQLELGPEDGCMYMFKIGFLGSLMEDTKTQPAEELIKRCSLSSEDGDLDPANRIQLKYVNESHVGLVQLKMELSDVQKGKYSHFMMKEIMEQATVMDNALRGRLYRQPDSQYGLVLRGLSDPPKKREVPFTLDRLQEDPVIQSLANARLLVFVACGTSWHSCLLAAHFFEQLVGLPTRVEYSSELLNKQTCLSPLDVVIGVSQSGETADTLEALKLVKSKGILTLGVVNVVGSSIARLTDAGVYTHSGPEIGVASTKAFVGQVVVLLLMGLRLAQFQGEKLEEVSRIAEALLRLPEQVRQMLGPQGILETVKRVCKSTDLRTAQNCLFLGAGYSYPVALEGALKMKEISYIHAEGLPAAEMKHGHIALVDSKMPVICLCPKFQNETYLKIQRNISQVKARGGVLFYVTDEDGLEDTLTIAANQVLSSAEIAQLKEGLAANKDQLNIIRTPNTVSELQPLMCVIPLQLMAFYVARARGCEIDKPRNLAKSVTVG